MLTARMSETALAWMPQPSGGANIIRCLWCFTLLMNLHDFVAEPVNPEHIFHDAHTVSFCLTADHIATCHMFLCPHQVSTVLVCLWTRVVWKTFGTRDEQVEKSGSIHGVPWTASGEVWQHPWSTMDSEWRNGQRVEKYSIHGVPWRGVVDTWQPPWSPMERCGGNVATSMESHGEVWWRRGSFHGVPWSAQFWIRVLMDGHDSWYWNALDSRSSEVSVLISGRLRRMVNEVFWKHFRVVYSWSTMSSSFVSCLAW